MQGLYDLVTVCGEYENDSAAAQSLKREKIPFWEDRFHVEIRESGNLPVIRVQELYIPGYEVLAVLITTVSGR